MLRLREALIARFQAMPILRAKNEMKNRPPVRKFDWRLLLSHSHWVEVRLNGRSLRLCARCSGTVAGFLAVLAPLSLMGLKIPAAAAPFCFVLAAPAAVDWVTQSWGLRESSNGLRLSTGFLEGAGVALLSTAPLPLTLKLGMLLYVAASILTLGWVGRIARGRGLYISCNRT